MWSHGQTINNSKKGQGSNPAGDALVALRRDD